MDNFNYRCVASTIGGSSTSNEAVLNVDTRIWAIAGEDGGVCTLTQYQLNAVDPVTAVGTWSCNLQQVTFSDIHSANATVNNLPEGNTNLIWTVIQDNVCGINYDLMVVTHQATGSIPSKPETPIGATEICKGSNLDFSTVEVADSKSYIWAIEPIEAGLVTGNTSTANINWNEKNDGRHLYDS